MSEEEYIEYLNTLLNVYTNELKTNLELAEDSYNMAKTNLDVLKPIINFLTKLNYQEENILMIEIALSSIYSSKLANKFCDKIRNNLLIINNYESEKMFDYNAYLRAKTNLNLFKKKLSIDYNYWLCIIHLNKRKSIKRSYEVFNRIANKLIYNQLLTNTEMLSLTDFIMSLENIKAEDKIKLISFLNIKREEVKKKKHQSTAKYQEIISIIDCPLNNSTINTPDDLNYCNGIINNIKNTLNNKDLNLISFVMPDITDLSINNYQYIMNNILNYAINKIKDIKEMVLDPEFINDAELCQEIINEYHFYLKVYDIFKNSFNLSMANSGNFQNKVEENKLLYLTTDLNGSAYIEKDLMQNGFPNEYYLAVKDLLNKLKTNSLNYPTTKPLISNKKFAGYQELRDDQIRIVYRHMANNYYIIYGAGVKKDDNDQALYNRLTGRYNNITADNLAAYVAYSENVDLRLNEYLLNNFRKGNR
jgi:hypothetical protein